MLVLMSFWGVKLQITRVILCWLMHLSYRSSLKMTAIVFVRFETIVITDTLNARVYFSALPCVKDTCWVGLFQPTLVEHKNMYSLELLC